MHIEHLNLVVSNIDSTLNFYRAAFPHWYVRGKGQSEWSGVQRNWLHFGDEMQFLTFNDNGIGNNRDLAGHQVGLAHFAFVTNNLDALANRLIDAGFPIAKQGQNTEFRKNLYFVDPSGFEVEFVEYLSDLPNERNSYDD